MDHRIEAIRRKETNMKNEKKNSEETCKEEKEHGITRRDFVVGAAAAAGALAATGPLVSSAFAQDTISTGNTAKGNVLMTSVWLHERSWEGVLENLKTNDIVLMPIGSVENHGVHSALSTDACWAMAAAEGVAKATGTICSPPIYAAYSRGHMAYPGSLNIRPEILSEYIVDIARSLMFHGYKKFVLFNGHRVSNLAPILCAVSKIHHTYGAYAGCIDCGLMPYTKVKELFPEPKGSEHAGDCETSMMLAYRPDLVDMSKSGNQPPCPNGAELEEFMTDAPMLFAPKDENHEASMEKERGEFNHGTHMATSKLATTEKGKEVLDYLIKRSIQAVESIKSKKVTLRYVDVIPM